MAQTVDIKVTVNGAANAKKELQGVQNAVGGKGSGLTGSFFAAGLAVQALTSALDLMGQATGVAINYLKSASQQASDFEKSMVTLEIVSGKFGISSEKATKAAAELGKELKIGPGAAAEALQNLFKGGLNLDQATDLLKRFTNEAITGKSSSISLADAVTNLSFAYNTESSALGNMSGISENFNNIIENGAKLMGKKTSELTDAERQEAKYRGMIELTNLTLGSSDRFTGTLIDTQARLDQSFKDISLTVGQAVNPILSKFLEMVIPIVNFVRDELIPTISQDEGVVGAFNEMKTAVVDAWAILTGNGDVKTSLEDLKTNFIDYLVTGIKGLFEVVTKVFTYLKEHPEEVSAAIDRISATFKALTDVVQFLVGLVTGVIDFGSKVQATFKETGEAITKAWEDGKKGVEDFINSVPGKIIEFVEKVKTKLKELPNEILFGIGQVIGKIVEFVTITAPAKWEEFKTNTSKKFEETKNNVVAFLQSIPDKITEFINSIPGKIEAFKATIVSKFRGIATDVAHTFSTVPTMIQAFINSIPGKIKSGINSVISLIEKGVNKIIDGYNSIPTIPDVGHIAIPRLARGTRNFGGGMAMVGENGPELVSMPKGSGVASNGKTYEMMVRAIKEAMGGGRNVNFNGAVSFAGQRGERQQMDVFSKLLNMA